MLRISCPQFICRSLSVNARYYLDNRNVQLSGIMQTTDLYGFLRLLERLQAGKRGRVSARKTDRWPSLQSKPVRKLRQEFRTTPGAVQNRGAAILTRRELLRYWEGRSDPRSPRFQSRSAGCGFASRSGALLAMASRNGRPVTKSPATSVPGPDAGAASRQAGT